MVTALIWAYMRWTGGWNVLLVLLFLADAAVFAARRYARFAGRDLKKKRPKITIMIDGGKTHD